MPRERSGVSAVRNRRAEAEPNWVRTRSGDANVGTGPGNIQWCTEDLGEVKGR